MFHFLVLLNSNSHFVYVAVAKLLTLISTSSKIDIAYFIKLVLSVMKSKEILLHAHFVFLCVHRDL